MFELSSEPYEFACPPDCNWIPSPWSLFEGDEVANEIPTPDEIQELQDYGVERIYHPDDGMQMGLVDMIKDLIARTKTALDNFTLLIIELVQPAIAPFPESLYRINETSEHDCKCKERPQFHAFRNST